jgi:hypothetical protein
MKSVAKHSYVKGKSGSGRISAHVDYLQNRPGHDREDGPRKFFNGDRDGISGSEIKRELQEQGYSKVVAHKLILSPGLDGVDVDAYTRKVMQEIQDEKGLDLKWWSVKHENTDHDHAHVVIAGLDKNGRDVNFDKQDYQKLREIGDQYLERNHFFERFLERDFDRLLTDRNQNVGLDRLLSNISYERTGDRQFKELLRDVQVREKKEKDKRETGEDEREFKKIDHDLKQAFQEGNRPGADFGKGHEQRLRESQGRLSESHGTYTGSTEINRLQQELERHPERSEEIQIHIEDLKRLSQEEQQYGRKFDDLDNILGTKPRGIDRQQGKEIDRAQGQQQVNETSRQIVTGELQKQLQPEHERDRDEDEDMFSRGER